MSPASLRLRVTLLIIFIIVCLYLTTSSPVPLPNILASPLPTLDVDIPPLSIPSPFDTHFNTILPFGFNLSNYQLTELQPRLHQDHHRHHTPKKTTNDTDFPPSLTDYYNHLTVITIPMSSISKRVFFYGYIDCYANAHITDPQESICLKSNLTFTATWGDGSPSTPIFWAQSFSKETGLVDQFEPIRITSGGRLPLFEHYNLDNDQDREIVASMSTIVILGEFHFDISSYPTSIECFLYADREQYGQGTIQMNTYYPIERSLGEIDESVSFMGSRYADQKFWDSEWNTAFQYHFEQVPLRFQYVFIQHFGAVQYDNPTRPPTIPGAQTIVPSCLINGLVAKLTPVMTTIEQRNAFLGYFIHAENENNGEPIQFRKFVDLSIQCDKLYFYNTQAPMGISVQILPLHHEPKPFPDKDASLSERYITSFILNSPLQTDRHSKYQFFYIDNNNRPAYFLSPHKHMIWSGNTKQHLTNEKKCVSLYMRNFNLTTTDFLLPIESLPFTLSLEHALHGSFMWGHYSLVKFTQQDYDGGVIMQSGPLKISQISTESHQQHRILFDQVILSTIAPFGPYFNRSEVRLQVSVAMSCQVNDDSASLSLRYDQHLNSATTHDASFTLVHVASYSPYQSFPSLTHFKAVAQRINLTDPRYTRYYEGDVENYAYRYLFQLKFSNIPDTVPFVTERDRKYPYPLPDDGIDPDDKDAPRLISNQPLRWLEVVIPSNIFHFTGDFNECYILTLNGHKYDHVVPMKAIDNDHLMPISPGEILTSLTFNYTFSMKVNQDGSPQDITGFYKQDYTLTCYDVFLVNATAIEFQKFDWDAHKHFKPEEYHNRPLSAQDPFPVPILTKFSHYIIPTNQSSFHISGTVIEFDPIPFDVFRFPAIVMAIFILCWCCILAGLWCYSSSDTALQGQNYRSERSKRPQNIRKTDYLHGSYQPPTY